MLKCDFHLHTVYSDGSVWPTTRVSEAFEEGLDAIAITEHFEFHHLNKDDVNAMENYNREYEIARERADRLGIMVVPGIEVTREVPAGHFNVLFIEDVNPLTPKINHENPRDTTTLVDMFSTVKRMGGFTFWNHPSYQNPSGAEWAPIHQKLYESGLIQGVEIINSGPYIPLVHSWADEKRLTKMANSDAHGDFALRDGVYRPMTLVFARDRSVEGIREALFAGRTVGYAHNYLYGKEPLVRPIFENSLKTRVVHNTDSAISIEIRNLSGLPFEIEVPETDNIKPAGNSRRFTLYGNETCVMSLTKKIKGTNISQVDVSVNNIHVAADTPLNAEVRF